MPSIEVAYLKQRAVYWPYTGIDRYSKPTVGEPEELRVRWINRRTQSLDVQGNVIALDATVIARQALLIGSQMWLGALADWYGTGTSDTIPDDVELMRVMNLSETPDLKARHTRYKAGLQRERANASDGS